MQESSLSTRSVAGRIAARRVALLLCQLLPAACLRLFACQALFVFALVAETDNQQDDQQPQKDKEDNLDDIEDAVKELLPCLLALSLHFAESQDTDLEFQRRHGGYHVAHGLLSLAADNREGEGGGHVLPLIVAARNV